VAKLSNRITDPITATPIESTESTNAAMTAELGFMAFMAG
jgi:hypothetical protein